MPVEFPSLLLPQPLTGTQTPSLKEAKGDGAFAAASSFKDVLAKQLGEVASLKEKADVLSQQFMAGKVEDVHQVMITAEEANLALQLTVQVRNKLIEAYQEIARMQV